MPEPMKTLDHAKLIVFAGSNAACVIRCCTRESLKPKKKPVSKVVVIDPRETDTCAIADLHLAVRLRH